MTPRYLEMYAMHFTYDLRNPRAYVRHKRGIALISTVSWRVTRRKDGVVLKKNRIQWLYWISSDLKISLVLAINVRGICHYEMPAENEATNAVCQFEFLKRLMNRWHEVAGWQCQTWSPCLNRFLDRAEKIASTCVYMSTTILVSW